MIIVSVFINRTTTVSINAKPEMCLKSELKLFFFYFIVIMCAADYTKWRNIAVIALN